MFHKPYATSYNHVCICLIQGLCYNLIQSLYTQTSCYFVIYSTSANINRKFSPLPYFCVSCFYAFYRLNVHMHVPPLNELYRAWPHINIPKPLESENLWISFNDYHLKLFVIDKSQATVNTNRQLDDHQVSSVEGINKYYNPLCCNMTKKARFTRSCSRDYQTVSDLNTLPHIPSNNCKLFIEMHSAL